MKEIKKLCQIGGLVISIIFIGHVQSLAQCNCKFTIPAGGRQTFDGAAKGVKGGDVICVSAGSISSLVFTNIKGALGNPVIIKNCGGQVLLGGATANNGMYFESSRYVRITGTGATGINYGFKVIQTKPGTQGITYAGLSSDVEIDHIEIANAGFAGIMVKTDPTSNCSDQSACRPNWTLYNVSIHDNYVYGCDGEGIYLGDSFYNGTTKFCGSMQYPHEVKGVRIFNNRFENTGREAIQVGCGVADVEIYKNSIYNYGVLNEAQQNGGVQLGSGTSAKFYGNFIKGGSGPALAIQGIGNEYVYNNVFVNPGAQAITLSIKPTPLATDIVNKDYLGGVYIINNTFVNAMQGVVKEFVATTVENVMYNNLIVASATVWDITYKFTTWKKGNNIVVPVLANAKFANASADDYRLLAGSPGVDAGVNVSAWGVTQDYDNKNRPSGTANDAGAFEFAATTAKPPVANAGTDKSITLPTSTLTLNGTATDADGTITSYAWTKQSGSTATLTNANTANLSLAGLVAGSYTFRLTVTDNTGLTAYDEIIVTVKAALLAPVVNAGADKTIQLPVTTATLNSTATDADGSVTTYAWTKQSGPAATLTNANTANLSLAGLVAGSYTFRITVTDNTGLTAYDEIIVTVKAVLLAPVVNAGADKTVQLPVTATTLNSTATDADGSITTYAWTKQSGPTATLTNANSSVLSLSGMVAGTYLFRVTVTDNSSMTAFDEVTVKVNTAVVTGGTILYRINAGGSVSADGTPINWSSDTQSAKSSYLDAGSLNFTRGSTSWKGTNTTSAPNGIFGQNRYSPDKIYGTPMQWNFPVASGRYEVRLYFAESPYTGGVSTSGARVFGVNMEGNAVLSNFDIYATAGMSALQKTVVVNVTDGTLDIDFIRITGDPQVNGIEILTASESGGRLASDTEVTVPETETKVEVYPNPFQSELNIQFSSEQKEVAVSLVSMSGQVVYTGLVAAESLLATIDLSHINVNPGLYILIIQNGNLKIQRKVIKE